MDLMNLYFIRSNGEKRLVKENIAENEVYSHINQYVNRLNPTYKIYYTRSWYSEDWGGTLYDVGSYSEFFLLGK